MILLEKGMVVVGLVVVVLDLVLLFELFGVVAF
jgi:hypothetical protein